MNLGTTKVDIGLVRVGPRQDRSRIEAGSRRLIKQPRAMGCVYTDRDTHFCQWVRNCSNVTRKAEPAKALAAGQTRVGVFTTDNFVQISM
jgi:hypothetical protein